MTHSNLGVNKHNKGFTVVALLGVLAAVVIVGAVAVGVKKGLDLFSDNDAKLKTEVAQVATLQKQADDKDAQIAALNQQIQAKQAQGNTDQTNQVRTGQQMTVGAGFALVGAPPSPQVKLASSLIGRANTALNAAIGNLPQAQQDEITQIVNQSLSGQQTQLDEANGALATKDAQLAAMTADRDQVKTDLIQLQAQHSTLQTADADIHAQLTAKTTEAQNTASEKSGLLAKIQFLTICIAVIIGILLLLNWVLPLMGDAYPEFAPFAKNAAAIIGIPLHLLHEAEKDALKASGATLSELLAKAKGALEAEQTAHAATQTALVNAHTIIAASGATPAPALASAPVVAAVASQAAAAVAAAISTPTPAPAVLPAV
jgi:hypothetical protein